MPQTDRAPRIGREADPIGRFRPRRPPRDTIEFAAGLLLGLGIGAAFTLGLKRLF